MKKPRRTIREVCPETGTVTRFTVPVKDWREARGKKHHAQAPSKAQKARKRRKQSKQLQHPASALPDPTPRLAHDDPAWLLITAEVLAVGHCQKCGSTKRLTVDHIIPLSLGGGNHRENLQCLCRRCNKRKGSRLPAHDTVFTLRAAG